MAQVDKLNYIPLLFWFVILFIMIYVLIMTRIVPYFFSIFKSRKNYYTKLMVFVKKGTKFSSMWVKHFRSWSLFNSNRVLKITKSSTIPQVL